jgi:hypothetical protein
MDNSLISNIINNNININESDGEGNILLHTLVSLNKKDKIIELLKYKPNILHKNNQKLNPIDLAIELNLIEIYQILSQYCVDNNIDYLSNLENDSNNSDDIQNIKNNSDNSSSSCCDDSNMTDSEYQSMSSSVSSSTSEISD